MKRMIFIVAVAILSATACHQKTTMDSNPVPVTEITGKKVEVRDLAVNKDLVCGMLLEDGSVADTTLYEGKLYGFCAPECKAAFVDSPQVYLAQ